MNKLGKVIASTLLIVLGLYLTIYGIINTVNSISYENRVYVSGEIVEIKGFESTWDSTHRVAVVRYYVDGEETTSEILYRAIVFRNADVITIYYDRANPEMISSDTADTILYIYIVVGLVLIGIGILLILKKKKRKMKRA
jgi:LPXTG-motif cell wall-anchored protein